MSATLLPTANGPLGAPSKPQPDLAEIQKSYDILAQGRVVEMRALKTTPEGTISGYYNDGQSLVDDTFYVSEREGTPNTYWTLQKIDPSVIKISNECYGHVAETTKDDQIVGYCWLPIDFDPIRDANTNSTDQEKAAAYDLALKVKDNLLYLAITSLLADSGNGYHLLIKVDLSIDKKDLVKSLLSRLSRKFSTSETSIDTGLFNPSRILKAYGSVSRKGPNTIERPWRTSRILDAECIELTTEDSLRKLNDWIGSKDSPLTSPLAAASLSQTPAKDIDESTLLYKRMLDGEHIPSGGAMGHNNTVQSFVGYLRETMRMETPEEIRDEVLKYSDLFDGRGNDFAEMVEGQAERICKKPVGEKYECLHGGKHSGEEAAEKAALAGTAPAAVTPNPTISSTAGEHDENWEPSNLDKDRGYARPEFPREIMIGTTIYDGLVVPMMEHEQKYPELVWLPAVQICSNYLSDKVFIYQQSVNLNMYLGTISPPGKFFKSSSDADASVLIITPGSTEGLGVAMAGNGGKHAIMYYDELTKMVAKCRIDASSFASDMLTFYDQGEYGNVIIASKKNYTFEAGTYCFGWQFCTTEKGFETNWPKLSALGAGFEDRMFFLTTPEKPMPSKRHRAADITDGVVKTRKALQKAVDQKEYKLQDLEEVDRVIDGLDPRTQDMIFRFALWFAVDLGRDEIDNDCLHRAKKLVDFRNQAMLFLDPPTGDNRFAVLQKRMIREIRRNGGKVPYRELRRNLDADDRGTLDWQTSYNGLSTSGRIVRWSVKNKNGKTMLMAGLLIDRKDNWEEE